MRKATIMTLGEMVFGYNVEIDGNLYTIVGVHFHEDDTHVTVKFSYPRHLNPNAPLITELTDNAARSITKCW